MQTSTRNILIGVGTVTAIVGGVALYRYLHAAQVTPIPQPPQHQPMPPRPPTGPGGVTTLPSPSTGTFVAPSWNQSVDQTARKIIADEWVRMGSPAYAPDVAVALAFAAANQIWPTWSWPKTQGQSATFLASSDPRTAIWSKLLSLANDQMLAGLGLTAKRVGLGEAICDSRGFTMPSGIDLGKLSVTSNMHPSWHLSSRCIGQNLSESFGLPNGYYLVLWRLNSPKLTFGPYQDLVPEPSVGGRPSGRTDLQTALNWFLTHPYDDAVSESLS